MNDSLPRPRASIVVPAHNEAAVIGELLRAVLDRAVPHELEVVVVVNGSTDDTASIARRFAGVRVLEIDTPSKVAALNAGDAAATVFPRIYLDADIGITLASLRAVVSALEDGALAAAPLPLIDTAGCSVGVRAYYAVWSRLGYVRSHVIGSGVYGLSASGRARFDRFPDVIADDQYVYELFSHHERVNPAGSHFVIRAPRRLRYVYRRAIRIALGNMQLNRMGHTVTAPGPGWRGVLREEPRLLGAGLVYVGTTALVKMQARRRLRAGAYDAWHRDDSSRLVRTPVRSGP